VYGIPGPNVSASYPVLDSPPEAWLGVDRTPAVASSGTQAGERSELAVGELAALRDRLSNPLIVELIAFEALRTGCSLGLGGRHFASKCRSPTPPGVTGRPP